jgi:hypothetical protein
MSKDDKPHNPDLPVTDRVCLARMETLKTEINGLKQTIYSVGATITIVVTIVQVVLFFLKR